MNSPGIKDEDRARYWPLWVIMLILSVVMTFSGIDSDALWYDESYSVATANHPMGEMLSLVSTDSHPPLYYILLRIAVVVFGNSLVVIRGLSAVSVIGVVALAYFLLRRRWGSPGSLAFAFLILATPMSIGAAHEARMYTLASFFVTGMVIAGYGALTENRKRDWVALVLFACAAAWTHYFALIAAGVYWCVIFAKTVATRDRSGLGKFRRDSPFVRCLFAGAAVLILYLPWAFNLVNQASRVAQNYWIQPLNGRSMLAILTFPFGQRFGGPHGTTSFFLFIAVHVISIAGIIRAMRKGDEGAFLPLSALLTYWLTFLAGVYLSWAIRPVFVERYLISCMGPLILALAWFVKSLGKKRAIALACALYFFTTAPILRSTYVDKVNGAGDLVAKEYADRVKPEDIFVHGSEHTFGILRYYFPNNLHYLYIPEDFIPFGNHAVFAPNAEFGHDLTKYANEPVTIWAVNRTGEYYSTPWAKLTQAPHRVAASGGMRQIRKEPGWLTILFQEVSYDPDKTESGSVGGSGYLTVTVRNVDPALGGQVVYALYASDPIAPGTFVASGNLVPTSPSVPITLADIPYGEYAMVAFHDLNGNFAPDFKDGKPLEGMAMGIDPLTLGGEPTFDALKFRFSEDKPTKDIEMYYIK